MTEARLKKLFCYWQKELRIQDWLLELVFVGSDEIDNAGRNGRCDLRKEGVVLLRKLSQWDEQFSEPEEVLVHELLHIRFAPDGYPDSDCVPGFAQEQGINALAKVLVEFRRETTKEEKE